MRSSLASPVEGNSGQRTIKVYRAIVAKYSALKYSAPVEDGEACNKTDGK
jgi:hypothetical protein